ncbi:MAG TPA: hypothetical protein VGD06_00340 [Acidobacteriota bacterium]
MVLLNTEHGHRVASLPLALARAIALWSLIAFPTRMVPWDLARGLLLKEEGNFFFNQQPFLARIP